MIEKIVGQLVKLEILHGHCAENEAPILRARWEN